MSQWAEAQPVNGAFFPHVLIGPPSTDAASADRVCPLLPGSRLSIRYRVPPSASALQWLEPAMTAGGKHPFVFTQCQPIHARSLFPCQDTPAARISYAARLEVRRRDDSALFQ